MADARRFFVPEITGETVLVGGAEFHHAKDVLRVSAGDRVILSANTPLEYPGEVVSVGKREMTVKVGRPRPCANEPAASVRLFAGFLKGDKTELIVQKATELGAAEIALFSSAYSSAYASESKLERLCRVAAEAAKQCGRSVCPPVLYFPDLASALERGAGAENKFFFCEFAEQSEGRIDALSGDTALVVGSEGGFTPAEFGLAREKGYLGMTLGRRILRAETAAIAALALAMRAHGELGQ